MKLMIVSPSMIESNVVESDMNLFFYLELEQSILKIKSRITIMFIFDNIARFEFQFLIIENQYKCLKTKIIIFQVQFFIIFNSNDKSKINYCLNQFRHCLELSYFLKFVKFEVFNWSTTMR